MLIPYSRAVYTLGAAGLCYLSACFTATAITITDYPKWMSSSTTVTGAAATCVFNTPELAPLSGIRTLVVDNNLPVGTELFQWGYNEFAPNINGYCTSTSSRPFSSSEKSNMSFLLILTNSYPDANGVYATSISGVGIKFYITYTSCGSTLYGTRGLYTTTLIDENGSISTCAPLINTEYILKGSSAPSGMNFQPDISSSIKSYSQQANHASYSIRATLVKTGSIVYTSTPLSLPGTPMLRSYPTDIYNWSSIPSLIGSSGITIIPPACRLKTPTDYNIDIGRWVHKGPGSRAPGVTLPAYGSATPVNISLECSGLLDNVYFRFEDAGTSPLANKNISLYNNSGTKIDGLEIEMLYGGNRINVDNSTKTNVGSHGTIKTDFQGMTFNSQSTIPFTARYVQRSAIKKGGVSYTGSVTGKVNMYVTYQ